MSSCCPFMEVCHGFHISSEAIVPKSESESEGNRKSGSQPIVFLSERPVAGNRARVV